MNKLTKGAIATAAGVILLMGGAGTLASWNSSAAAGASQAITAGSLAVTTTGTPGVWKSGTTVITPSTFKIVPGDSITYTQTYNLNATGDNLLFTVVATPGAISAPVSGATAFDTALAGKLTAAATFAVSGANITASSTLGTYKVASNSGSSTVTITETVTFPYGSVGDNSAQTGNVTFGAGAITLTQTQTA
jgi:alternate signal-mediated exported protein